jgi:hypothetical protein
MVLRGSVLQKVAGCESARAEEIAGFTVDIALGAIQLVMPDYSGRNIARITARDMPTLKTSLVIEAGGEWRGMNTVTEPGLGLTPDAFKKIIAKSSSDFALMGRRIEAYRTGIASLPTLEQAWCDATFWYHEAFSEALDTIAIAKLETAIESLFASGSARRARRDC